MSLEVEDQTLQGEIKICSLLGINASPSLHYTFVQKAYLLKLVEEYGIEPMSPVKLVSQCGEVSTIVCVSLGHKVSYSFSF